MQIKISLRNSAEILKVLFALVALQLCLLSTAAFAEQHGITRKQIRVVGSSTVYPFSTVVAEQFGRKNNLSVPIVEANGTGGGFKIFCSGVGSNFPDVVNASRRIKDSELELCSKNGISSPLELKIGYDAIVLASSSKSERFNLTKQEVFLALAKQVPNGGKLVNNFYQKWSDINPKLPNIPILVYGPPSTSGTRDSFAELIMESGCKAAHVKSGLLENLNKRSCSILRTDGKYVEIGENDNITIQKISINKGSVGIFSFSYFEENKDVIKTISIDGVEPTLGNISEYKYPCSRPLFVYFKREHLKEIIGLGKFAKEFVSDESIGKDGYLVEHYLIPLTPQEKKDTQNLASQALL